MLLTNVSSATSRFVSPANKISWHNRRKQTNPETRAKVVTPDFCGSNNHTRDLPYVLTPPKNGVKEKIVHHEGTLPWKYCMTSFRGAKICRPYKIKRRFLDWNQHLLGVSKNQGTPKWMVYNGKTLLKGMIWGYHHFRKHPFRFPGVKLWGGKFPSQSTCTVKAPISNEPLETKGSRFRHWKAHHF